MALYSIRLNLELDEPSGVYTVTSPDVPGLVTEGSTPEEITHNVQEAVEGLILALKELGEELPPVLRKTVERPTETQALVLLPTELAA